MELFQSCTILAIQKAVLNYTALLMADGTDYALTVTPTAYAAAEERNRVSRRVRSDYPDCKG